MSQILLKALFILVCIEWVSTSAFHKPPQIVKELHDVALKFGNINRFVLECRGLADPPPTYKWFKDGVEILEGEMEGIRFMSAGDHSQLDFTNPSSSHEGYYYCEATNSLGKARSSVSHVAKEFPTIPEGAIPPTFVRAPQTEIQSLGSKVDLVCETEGNPTPKIEWMKNGEKISGEAGPHYVINSLSENDVANYACNASNVVGHVYKNIIVNILTVAARIKEGPKANVVASKGSNVSLICEAEGFPLPSIIWNKSGENVIEQSDKYQFNKATGELTVLRANMDDNGIYTCTATNHGSDSVSTNLEVKDKTTILKGPEDRTEPVLTSLLEMPCEVVADVSLDLIVNWKKNNIDLGQPGFPLDERIYQAGNHSLFIHNLKFGDAGTYTCVAGTVTSDPVTDSGFLNVVGIRPELTVTPNKAGDRLEGEEVILECQLSQVTVPEPRVFWYKDEQEVTPDIATVDDNNTLTIVEAEVGHSGSYICKAQNSEGSASQTIFLAVHPHSYVKSEGIDLELKHGDTIILDCETNVAPELKPGLQVDWLKDGVSLGFLNSLNIRGPSETLTVELEDEEDPCQNLNDNTTRYHLLSNFSLKICSANISDIGIYQCQLVTELEERVLGQENSLFIVTRFPWWILILALIILLLFILIICICWHCKKRKRGKGYYGMDVEGNHNKSDIYYTTEDADSIMQEMDATLPEGLLNQMEAKIAKNVAADNKETKTPIFTPKTIRHLSNVDRSAGSLGSLLEDDSFLDRGMDEDGSFRERYAE